MLGGVSPRQHGPSYRDIIDAFLHLMHFRGRACRPWYLAEPGVKVMRDIKLLTQRSDRPQSP